MGVPWSVRTSEKHKSETHLQGSMMFKLVIARGINTAFLLFIVTADTEQLDADTLQQVHRNVAALRALRCRLRTCY